jgi:hypothetical protein
LEQFSAAQALWLTAALSGGVALSSGLLALHYRRESYSAGEKGLFRARLIVSPGFLPCSSIWATLIFVFG